MFFQSQKMVNINQNLVDAIAQLGLTETLSIHALAKRINKPYTSVHRHVSQLSMLGVINIKQQGKASFISFNFENELTPHLLSLVSYFKKQSFLKHHPILKIISKEFVFNAPLLLFGSYAKKTTRKGSDFDLCVIGLSPKEEKSFKKSIQQIELIHKIEINCLFFKKTELITMLKTKGHNVGKEIFLNHIILKKADLWHNLITEVHDDIKL